MSPQVRTRSKESHSRWGLVLPGMEGLRDDWALAGTSLSLPPPPPPTLQENPYQWNQFAYGKFPFYNKELLGLVRANKNQTVREFWRLLALCHTVMVHEKGSEHGSSPATHKHRSSPPHTHSQTHPSHPPNTYLHTHTHPKPGSPESLCWQGGGWVHPMLPVLQSRGG